MEVKFKKYNLNTIGDFMNYRSRNFNKNSLRKGPKAQKIRKASPLNFVVLSKNQLLIKTTSPAIRIISLFSRNFFFWFYSSWRLLGSLLKV